MNVIDPYEVTSTTLTATNVTEDDFAEWSSGTTYAKDDDVIVIGDVHKIYRSVSDGNLDNAPSYTTATNDHWVYVGATNKWKPFDGQTADRVSRTTPLTYEFTDPRIVTDLAFFNVDKATEVVVVVTDPSDVEIYSKTISLIDVTHMTDWFQFFTQEPRYVRQKIVSGLPAVAGSTISLTFNGPPGSTVGVGQIAFGRAVSIGTTMLGTRPGYVSYSRKDRDTFGNALITKRGFKRRVDFTVAVAPANVDNIINDLAALDAKGAVYFADNDIDFLGCTLYGLIGQFDVPQGVGVSILQTEVQGL